MDENLINCCCISEEEARRILQGATKNFSEINKIINDYVNEQLHELNEKVEELKKENEALKYLAFPGVMSAPAPSRGDKFLPCCCDCPDSHFMKDIATNIDSEV